MTVNDELLTPIVRTDARILTLDIERLPGVATVRHRGLTITGDFWDLGGWRDTIRRRIHPDEVTEWPRTICLAWKWYHSKRVEFAAEWDAPGREDMLRQAWELFDKADIVYGHAVQTFDARKLNGEWNLLGLPAPSPVKFVDTLKEARRAFGYESNTLGSLTARMGIPTKTDKYDVAAARAACAGDKAAQRKLKAYNVGDIKASEALVDRLRGWLPMHPSLSGPVPDGVLICPQCGSDDLEPNGWHLAVVQEYGRWRCRNCGGNLRNSHMRRVSNIRGIR